MNGRRVFRARFELVDEWWSVTVEGVGVATPAQTLARARAHAEELVVSSGAAAAGRFELERELVLPPAVRRAMDRQAKARAKADAAAEEARQAVRGTLDALAAAMPSIGARDMGDIVGLSAPRIWQLQPGRPRGGRRPEPKQDVKRAATPRKQGS